MEKIKSDEYAASVRQHFVLFVWWLWESKNWHFVLLRHVMTIHTNQHSAACTEHPIVSHQKHNMWTIRLFASHSRRFAQVVSGGTNISVGMLHASCSLFIFRQKKIRKYLLVICLLFGDFKPIHHSPLINWPRHVAVRHRWFATSKQIRICKVSAWRMMGWTLKSVSRTQNKQSEIVFLSFLPMIYTLVISLGVGYGLFGVTLVRFTSLEPANQSEKWIASRNLIRFFSLAAAAYLEYDGCPMLMLWHTYYAHLMIIIWSVTSACSSS